MRAGKVRTPGTRIVRDRKGGVNLLFAVALPLMLGMSAFAVDLGSAALETRKLQGIADAAALAAANDPQNAQALAQASVAASGWSRTITVTATPGTYTRTNAPTARFAAGGASPDAVKVRLETASPPISRASSASNRSRWRATPWPRAPGWPRFSSAPGCRR